MYRKGVSALITNKNQEFLLVNLISFEEKYFAVPGGGVEDGESLEETVYREIEEELGIAEKTLEFVGRSNIPLQFKFKVITMNRDGKEYEGSERYFFGFNFIGSDYEIKLREDEVRSYKWVPFDELKDYLLFDNQLEETTEKIMQIFPFLEIKIAQDFQKRLLTYIENNYNSSISLGDVELPPQGMSSFVFFIKLSNGTECAVKYGNDAMKDVPALELITKEKINIPIPTLIASFIFEDVPVIILKKINFPLFESVPVEEMPKYIPSIVKSLNELHRIKSDTPGFIAEKKDGETWKNMMLSIFDGSDINWNVVAERESLDKDLILTSVEKIKSKIENTIFDLKEYSLLHTDFNQRNLFVDPATNEISGIVDWEDAMFGDPLYDFARVHMYLWHFNFSQKSVDGYYDLVNFSEEQKKLEDLYWLSRVIQYLAWYSEELTEFNLSRINLHQEYLRNYIW